MDCRKPVMAAWCLLLGTLGCAHTQGGSAPPARETNPPPLAASSSHGKPVAEAPKRQPLPLTCVALGNHFAAEALAMEPGSTKQEQTRNAARKEYQQALGLDPNCLDAYQRLGRLYVDMKDYSHAVATYQTALAHYPTNAGVWFDLGMCHHLWKEWPAAIDCLTHAVNLDPENPQFVKMLAYTQAAAGQYPASLQTLSRVFDEATGNYELARCLHGLKQDNAGRPFAQAALQMNPNLKPAQALLVKMGSAPHRTAAIQQAAYTEDAAAPARTTSGTPQQLPREVMEGPSLSPSPGAN